MRGILTMIGTALALVAMAVAQGPQRSVSGDSPARPAEPEPAAKATAASAPGSAHPREKQAIRLAAAAFAQAYNAGDAQAISRLFLPDGEIVREESQSTQGREAVEQEFAGIFKEHPKTHMDLAIESIRFIGSDMAVEEGVANVTHGPDEPAQRSPYSVTYARQDGKWLTAIARDLPDEAPTPEEQLKQLEWMIGEWVDESPDALVMSSYRWTNNQCYIHRLLAADRSGHGARRLRRSDRRGTGEGPARRGADGLHPGRLCDGLGSSGSGHCAGAQRHRA